MLVAQLAYEGKGGPERIGSSGFEDRHDRVR
jgi:hypothetical protein